jgi:nitroimidazol reductase NimA-like FMN-containing flavoprotein (pyridoxamine 5'-phosphate oxidase superfamily)
MKMGIMRKNPDVCLQTDIMQNMANWKSVIVWGRFEELEDGNDRNHALQQLNERILPLVSSETAHLSPLWPFQPDNNSNIEGIVFRIHITKKTGRFENYSVIATSSF